MAGLARRRPLLLDGYEIQIEQLIMSDTWQQVLLVTLLWSAARHRCTEPAPSRARWLTARCGGDVRLVAFACAGVCVT